MADTISKFRVEHVITYYGFDGTGRRTLKVIHNYGDISAICRIKAIQFFLGTRRQSLVGDVLSQDACCETPYSFCQHDGPNSSVFERTWSRLRYRVTLIEEQVKLGNVFTSFPKWSML